MTEGHSFYFWPCGGQKVTTGHLKWWQENYNCHLLETWFSGSSAVHDEWVNAREGWSQFWGRVVTHEILMLPRDQFKKKTQKTQTTAVLWCNTFLFLLFCAASVRRKP